VPLPELGVAQMVYAGSFCGGSLWASIKVILRVFCYDTECSPMRRSNENPVRLNNALDEAILA